MAFARLALGRSASPTCTRARAPPAGRAGRAPRRRGRASTGPATRRCSSAATSTSARPARGLFDELARALRPQRPDRPRRDRPPPRPRARDGRAARPPGRPRRGSCPARASRSASPTTPRSTRRFATPKRVDPPLAEHEIVSSPGQSRSNRDQEEIRWRPDRAVPGRAGRAAEVERRQVERPASGAVERGRAAPAGTRSRPASEALYPALGDIGAQRQERRGVPRRARAQRHAVARPPPGGRRRRRQARPDDPRRRQRAGQQPGHPRPLTTPTTCQGARAAARPGAAGARQSRTAPDATARHRRPPAARRGPRATPPTRRSPRPTACAGAPGSRPEARSPPTTSSPPPRSRRGCGDLSPAELREVRTREKRGKARKSVLDAIERQLK